MAPNAKIPILPPMPTPLASSASELNEKVEWFSDPSRTEIENKGPFVVVLDNFYRDPEAVRDIALKQKFVRYSPPSEEHVSEAVFSPYRNEPGAWYSTAFLVFKGIPISKPELGFRFDADWIRRKIEGALSEQIPKKCWSKVGDGWNGAFHYMSANWTAKNAAIHHHYKEGDVVPHGWSGLVYLSSNPKESSGTSIWRNRISGKCVGSLGAKFAYEHASPDFELALLVENRYNRLLLFRENVFHRAENGYGSNKFDSRLTQTFFFVSNPMQPSPEVDPDFGTRGLVGKAAVSLLNGADHDEENETEDRRSAEGEDCA